MERRHVECGHLNRPRGCFEEQAGRLPGLRVLSDLAAWRVGRVRGDAEALENHRVHDRHMGRDVHCEDRASRGDAIELCAREVPHLVEHRVVVAKPDQPSVSRLRRVDLPQCVESLRNRLDGADRRTVQVGCDCNETRTWEMTMRFDEAGDDRAAVEVELDFGFGDPWAHVFVATHGNDSVVLDHQGGRLSTLRVHREHVPVRPDLKSWWRRVQTKPRDSSAHHDKNEQHDERPDDSHDDLPHRRMLRPTSGKHQRTSPFTH